MKSKILFGFSILVPLFLMGCITGGTIMKDVVEKGDKIAVEYKGTFDKGEIFDQSSGKPLEFTAGAGQMIKGFDDAVIGMKLNEKKTIRLTPDLAYGEIDETKETSIPKDQFPADFKLKIGEQVPLQANTGQMFLASIKEVKENEVILDLNHPMAGKTLNFEITVVKIEG